MLLCFDLFINKIQTLCKSIFTKFIFKRFKQLNILLCYYFLLNNRGLLTVWSNKSQKIYFFKSRFGLSAMCNAKVSLSLILALSRAKKAKVGNNLRDYY